MEIEEEAPRESNNDQILGVTVSFLATRIEKKTQRAPPFLLFLYGGKPYPVY